MSEAGEKERPQERRIVAIVLPELLCELAGAGLSSPGKAGAVQGKGRQRGGRAVSVGAPRVRAAPPFGVLLVEDVAASAGGGDPSKAQATAVLAAVNDAARRFGVRSGQTVVEARALFAKLVVREVEGAKVHARLGEIAELALGFGPTVALEAPDTVWVDVTGAAHLAGGEEALTLELGARVRALGHAVRVAVSSGPRLAQAFARWGRVNREGSLVVPVAETARCVAALPVRALPIDGERVAWLMRLGVVTLGDLTRLPRAASAPRLGEDAGRVLDLAEGRDDAPLVAYVPPAIPEEETTWDDPAFGVEPLLFVLRGLVSRLGARLEGRGEAVQALDLSVLHDRAVARLEGVAAQTTFHFELAAPLWRAEELFRVIASRIGRAELPAPTVGLRLEARAITRALALQLHLSRYAAGLGGNAARGPEILPVVLAELLADLGKDRVGMLRLEASHRPEKRSQLVPVTPATLASGSARPPEGDLRAAPTRLLAQPIPFNARLQPGATVSIDHRLYSVGRVAFERRLTAVEWWTEAPVSRDYSRVWLEGASGGIEAVVYVDRNTGARMIQAFSD
jgi:protein ImuB